MLTQLITVVFQVVGNVWFSQGGLAQYSQVPWCREFVHEVPIFTVEIVLGWLKSDLGELIRTRCYCHVTGITELMEHQCVLICMYTRLGREEESTP